MKTNARILVAIAFLLGLTSAVNAESQDGVIVSIPFQFVAGTTSLPAGTYRVRSSSDNRMSTVTISNRDNGTSMFVLPYVSESATTDKPELSFEQVGGRYVLSTIETLATVYRFRVSHIDGNETVVKANDGVSASVSHGTR